MFQNNQITLLYNCFWAELSQLFLPKIILDKQLTLYNNSFGETDGAQKKGSKTFFNDQNSVEEIKAHVFPLKYNNRWLGPQILQNT